MSFVSYSTQLGGGRHMEATQQSQEALRVFMVYLNNMNDSQTELLKEAQDLLRDILLVGVISSSEVIQKARHIKYFVIPYPQAEIIKLIRMHVEKPIIYTARCVIEACKHRHIPLPTRTLAVSLSMIDCKIFPVKSCNITELRLKINEMCGTVLADFSDPKLNVVITDRADDKYCVRARARNVAVVSRDWVDETHAMSRQTDEHHINHDALTSLAAYQIRPFLGLKFKIMVPHLGKELRDLISNNGGKLVFGNEDATHVVAERYPDNQQQQQRILGDFKDVNEPRVVDVEFLRVCDRLGFYLNKKEYRTHLNATVQMKQECLTQPQQNDSLQSDCFTPPQQNPQSTLSSIRSNGYDRINENQSMPPPSLPLSRPRLGWNAAAINDIVLKALSSNDNATQQTQMASTQMRGIPENDIRFERLPESSQQLYWSDNISRRNF